MICYQTSFGKGSDITTEGESYHEACKVTRRCDKDFTIYCYLIPISDTFDDEIIAVSSFKINLVPFSILAEITTFDKFLFHLFVSLFDNLS